MRTVRLVLVPALVSALMLLAAPPPLHATDSDGDGLDDALEAQLAQQYAPVVFLHPLEPNYPANVDWYLSRARMRFDHSCDALALCCGDHGILDWGLPNQQNLISQAHGKQGWSLLKGCHHYDTQYSDRDFSYSEAFFLQLHDGDHTGSLYPFDWKVYVHSYPNTHGGVNLQYWFFYAYDTSTFALNHEADWENIIVVLDGAENVVEVRFARHDDSYHPISPSNVTWFQGTHPMVLSAIGSHASYESFAACDGDYREYGCAWGDPSWRWFTWSGGRPAGEEGYQGGGLVMVGEKDQPLNGQSFVRYSGRWGEIGPISSGPRGPAYQGKWNDGRATSGGGGNTGGGGSCDPETAIVPCQE